MRRALIVLLIATICSLYLAAGVAEAGKLRVTPKEAAERETVEISGSTGCNKTAGVHIRSLLRRGRRAIRSGSVEVRNDGTFSTTRRVRTTAVDNVPRNFTIVSHCGTARGKRSGKTTLRVLPFTGLPVLPQLLLAFGLIGGGSALLLGDRRVRASRRRQRPTMPLPVSYRRMLILRHEEMIARWAPKAD